MFLQIFLIFLGTQEFSLGQNGLLVLKRYLERYTGILTHHEGGREGITDTGKPRNTSKYWLIKD